MLLGRPIATVKQKIKTPVLACFGKPWLTIAPADIFSWNWLAELNPMIRLQGAAGWAEGDRFLPVWISLLDREPSGGRCLPATFGPQLLEGVHG